MMKKQSAHILKNFLVTEQSNGFGKVRLLDFGSGAAWNGIKRPRPGPQGGLSAKTLSGAVSPCEAHSYAENDFPLA